MQNQLVEQDDQDLQWLAREAPQFHTHLEPPRLPASYSPQPHGDDVSSDSSDNESAGSDSEDDPYNPYKFQDPAKEWVHNGDFVYAADDLQDSYLSVTKRIDDDNAPYVPPKQEARDNAPALFLPPDESTQGMFVQDAFVYRDAVPHAQPKTFPPLELNAPLPPSPRPAASAQQGPQTRRTAGPSRQRTARAAQDLSFAYPDYDDDADTSGDDASEDEYVPSPRVRTRKLPSSRTKPRSRPKSGCATRYSVSPYPSSSTSMSEPRPGAGARRPGSRNLQIDQPPPPRGSWAKTGPDAYKCPYCGHLQANKRSPDLERHIRSHFRRAVRAQWVCCGLPVKEAVAQGSKSDHNPWYFNGTLMVGGCHEDFSRMDALKRHWRNDNNQCVGDIRYARVDDASL
ncbi:hypothetical protein BD413DRAFT_604562 [Trametes elegans]|nr:hypothetical protein BD413DRAFT_604562 [Trametes elegans]